MKTIILLIFLLIISGCSNYNIKKICFDEICFIMEIADDNEERTRGLMHRGILGENKGMLFIFENEDYHSFWMKNTLTQLDIIWIDSEKEVVFIKEKALLCEENCDVFIPDKKARYAIEINSGKAKELDIKIGDKVNF